MNRRTHPSGAADVTAAPSLHRGVTPAERRWVNGFALAVLLLTSMPYLLGWLMQGADYRFTGMVLAVEDGNTYLGKMLLGSIGFWRYRSAYTAVPAQPGYWLFTIYLLSGKLAAAPALHEQLAGIFQVFRWAAGWLTIRAAYDFLAYFIPVVRWRRWGLALYSLGGGLGWLVILLHSTGLFNDLPLEMYAPEAFTFLHIYLLPHLALARAALLWMLLAYLKFWDARVRGWGGALRLGGWWLLIGVGQPMTMGMAAVVVGVHMVSLAWGLWRRSAWTAGATWSKWWAVALRVAIAGALPVAFMLYMLWLPTRDEFVRLWTAQNLIISPAPVYYLAAYGLAAPLAWAGARRLWTAQPRSAWLLIGWVLTFPLLAYLPLAIQRRLIEGVWAAWSVLAIASFLPAAQPEAAAAGGAASVPDISDLPATGRGAPVDADGYAPGPAAFDAPPASPGAGSAPDPAGEFPLSPPHPSMDAASLSGASLDRSTPARLWKSRRLSVKWILLVLAFPTTLLLWSGSLATVLRPMPPQYQPADLVRVFEWLQANAPVDSVALAAYNTSNPLPAWAPLRMVIGHRPENAHWEQVIPRVEAFYQTTTSDETRRALLKEFGVKYVIWGPNERLYGDWLPEGVAYLRLVYQSGVYQLYEVNPAP